MIDPLNISTLFSITAIITAICGAWLSIRRVAKDAEKQRKIHAAEILQDAKEADAVLKARFDNKFNELESEIKVVKEGVDKDISHLKETHNGEIRFLGQKIEELRSEVRNQHSQLVQLLSKMIDKKD
jgi:hypothetical protein